MNILVLKELLVQLFNNSDLVEVSAVTATILVILQNTPILVDEAYEYNGAIQKNYFCDHSEQQMNQQMMMKLVEMTVHTMEKKMMKTEVIGGRGEFNAFGDEGGAVAGASAGAGVEAGADGHGVIDCQSTCHMQKKIVK